MAAWTVGGPGFFLIRACTSTGAGLAILWSYCQLAAWIPPQENIDLTAQNAVAFLGVTLGVSYLASLMVAGISYSRGWRLLPDVPDIEPNTNTSQLSLRDLFLLITSIALICAVVVPASRALPQPSGWFSNWMGGVVIAAVYLACFGAPMLANIVASLLAGVAASPRNAVYGMIVPVTAALITGAYFTASQSPDDPGRMPLYALIPAALAQYWFIVLGIGAMRLGLAISAGTPDAEKE
jgi:hypothetical protein